MGAMKTYLQEATDLVQKHQNWSMESLVGVFCKNMKCDQGTGVYFIEKVIESGTPSDWYSYDFEGDYDGI